LIDRLNLIGGQLGLPIEIKQEIHCRRANCAAFGQSLAELAIETWEVAGLISPRHCCATTLGKLFTPLCLRHQAI